MDFLSGPFRKRGFKFCLDHFHPRTTKNWFSPALELALPMLVWIWCHVCLLATDKWCSLHLPLTVYHTCRRLGFLQKIYRNGAAVVAIWGGHYSRGIGLNHENLLASRVPICQMERRQHSFCKEWCPSLYSLDLIQRPSSKVFGSCGESWERNFLLYKYIDIFCFLFWKSCLLYC